MDDFNEDERLGYDHEFAFDEKVAQFPEEDHCEDNGLGYQYETEYEEILFDTNKIKLEKPSTTDLHDGGFEIREFLTEDNEESTAEHKDKSRKKQKKEPKCGNPKAPLFNRPKDSCIYCGHTIQGAQHQAVHYADEHKELDDEKIVFVCPSCGEEFSTEEVWQTHCNEIHNLDELNGLSMVPAENDEGKVQCITCSTILRRRKPTLLIHASMHMPHKLYKCKYCAAEFRNKWMIRTHFCGQFEQVLKLKLPSIDYVDLANLQRERECRNLIHVCPVCGEEFDLQQTWEEHLATEHEISNNIEKLNVILVPAKDGEKDHWNCGVCAKTWNKLDWCAIKPHVFSHMPFKWRKCRICKTSSAGYISCYCQRQVKSKYKLNLVHIEGCTLLCTKCDASSENFSELNNHYYSAHNIHAPEDLNFKLLGRKNVKGFLTYECTKCKSQSLFQAQTYTAMFMHALKHDNADWLKCKYCTSTYRDAFNMKNHAYMCQSATGSLRVFNYNNRHIQNVCPACGKPHTAKRTFKTHLMNDHGFSNISNLNIVEVKRRVNNDNDDVETHYECTVCKCCFTTYLLKELQNHAFQHMPFKLYNCKMCNSGFDTQLEIVDHLEQMHNIQKSQPKIRSEKSLLKVLLENEKIRFRCPTCNIRLKSGSAFLHHINKEHKFNTLAGLALKVRTDFENTNQEKKSYECLECGKRLGYNLRSMHRYNHRFTHLPYKPYSCCNCKKSFSNTQVVLMHVQKCKGRSERCRKKQSTNANKINVENKSAKEESADNIETASTTATAVEDPLHIESTTLAEITKVRTFSSNESATMLEFGEHITYACPECNVPLATQTDYQTHIALKHNFFDEDQLNSVRRAKDDKFECTECGVVVEAAISQRQRHKLTHLPHKSYICAICGHRSNTAFVLVGHIRRRHFTAGSYKCVICNLVLETPYKNMMHCRTEHTEAEYPPHLCAICMVIYRDASSLRKHNEMHDFNRKVYTCSDCEPHRMYKTEAEYKKHLKSVHSQLVVSKIIPVNCLICQKCFKDRIELAEHIKAQHDDDQSYLDPFICKYCHQKFRTHLSLLNHTDAVHAALPRQSPFPCDLCDRRFVKKESIEYHWKKMHCGMKITMTKKELEDQQEDQLNQNAKVDCLICLQMFDERLELAEHIKTQHSDEKVDLDPLVCKHCHQQFTRLSLLTIHTAAVHSALPRQNPFPCDECELRFGKKKDLNNHWKACHSGIKITMKKKEWENEIKKSSKEAHKPVKQSVKQRSKKSDMIMSESDKSITEEDSSNLVGLKRICRPRKRINYDESQMHGEEEKCKVGVNKKQKCDKPPPTTYLKNDCSDSNDEITMDCKPDVATILSTFETEYTAADATCTKIKDELLSDCDE